MCCKRNTTGLGSTLGKPNPSSRLTRFRRNRISGARRHDHKAHVAQLPVRWQARLAAIHLGAIPASPHVAEPRAEPVAYDLVSGGGVVTAGRKPRIHILSAPPSSKSLTQVNDLNARRANRICKRLIDR